MIKAINKVNDINNFFSKKDLIKIFFQKLRLN